MIFAKDTHIRQVTGDQEDSMETLLRGFGGRDVVGS